MPNYELMKKQGAFRDGLFVVELTEKNNKYGAWLHSFKNIKLNKAEKQSREKYKLYTMMHDLVLQINRHLFEEKLLREDVIRTNMSKKCGICKSMIKWRTKKK